MRSADKRPTYDSVQDADSRRLEQAEARKIRIKSGIARFVIASTLAGGVGYWLGGYKPHAVQESASVQANLISLEPIEQPCVDTVRAIWDVSGTFEYPFKIKDTKIPGIGASVKVKGQNDIDPEKKEVSTRVVGEICQADGTYVSSVMIDATDDKTIVKVPVSKLEANTQFPSGNKNIVVDPYSGMKVVGGGASILSGIGGLGCSLKGKVFGGGEECKENASKIDEFKRKFDERVDNWTEDTILEAMRTQVMPQEWDDIKQAINDAYDLQAIRKYGDKPEYGGEAAIREKVVVEFVDDAGNPTTELPKFTDVFEKERAAGLLARPNVDLENEKLVFTQIEPGNTQLDGEEQK